jgi:hypothetical protein
MRQSTTFQQRMQQQRQLWMQRLQPASKQQQLQHQHDSLAAAAVHAAIKLVLQTTAFHHFCCACAGVQVMPRYVYDRAEKLGRARHSRAQDALIKKTEAAQELVARNALRILNNDIGLAQVASSSDHYKSHTVCLAELSCECPDYSRFKAPCKHIRAVEMAPTCKALTHGMRLTAAERINKHKALVPVGSSSIAATKVYTNESLATLGEHGGQACFTISPHDPYFSSLGFALHGTCVHLIAAAHADHAELQDVISRSAPRLMQE